ncbi:MAG: hypothetical protein QM528_07440 [Phycisphaerales bacterium]|nr:hypothetical protein [Phycisphaerales bacterium]
MNPKYTFTLKFNVGDGSLTYDEISCNNPMDAIRTMQARYGGKLRNLFIVKQEPYKW